MKLIAQDEELKTYDIDTLFNDQHFHEIKKKMVDDMCAYISSAGYAIAIISPNWFEGIDKHVLSGVMDDAGCYYITTEKPNVSFDEEKTDKKDDEDNFCLADLFDEDEVVQDSGSPTLLEDKDDDDQDKFDTLVYEDDDEDEDVGLKL